MALDMEGEFYKLARNVLGKPKNLYKMASIGPRSGRVNVMGADGFIVVGSSILRSFTKGPEKKAYRTGKKCGREMFGSLIKEFDEEIEDLPASKLMELAVMLSSTLGWGDFEVKEKKGSMTVKAMRTIELKYKNSKHHELTSGLLAGLASRSMRKDMDARVTDNDGKSVTVKIRPA
ncbi:MAG: hypothetical protein U9R75_04370 [Candidatus Thermoplasmatota archaeon]|nr:hypothetical protein [Candidatus Thermoplasmatota archaeon]